MRLRQIEVFHAVYTSGSMTNAAALLHVSQPSISKVLAHAEQQLGYPLFDRAKGKLVPTPEAHRIFEYVATVYQNVDQLRRVSTNLRASDAGRVRIGATPAFGIDLLPRAVSAYRAAHADTVFEIETLHHDALNEALLESRIDIGLAFDPVPVPGIATDVLAKAEFVVLAPSSVELGGRSSLGIADIAALPFIRISNRDPLGRKLSVHLESSDAELNVVTLTDTYHVAKALVTRGVGATIVDEITANSSGHDEMSRAKLKPELRFDVAAMHCNAVPLSIVARRFVEHLRASLREFLRQS